MSSIGAICDAVARHHQHVVLDVLADFQNAVVFEQRLDQRDGVAQRHLSGSRAATAEQIVAPSVWASGT